MEINVQTTGVEELMRKLEALGRNSERILERGMEKGCKRLQAEIKVNTPVDTGDLRNSISVEKVGRLKFEVGTNKEYAVPVEYGTGKFGDPAVEHTAKDSWVYYDEAHDRFVTTHGHPATHFMHNAFMATKNEVVVIVIKELSQELMR